MSMDTLRKKTNPWVLYETEVPHSRFCDPGSGVSPAEKLSPEQLKLLRDAFTMTPTAGDRGRRRDIRGRSEERGMKFEEFLQVLRRVVGPNIEDTWVERFFNEVDVTCEGQVRWQQLCSYLVLEYTERERASIPAAALLHVQPQITHCAHNKREPTVRVVAVSNPPPLRYVSVSKGGQITVWNSGLHILKTVGLAGDPTVEVANTRRFRGWTTDAVYMGSVNKVAVATDCRDLHFLDVSTANVFEDVHLFGFPSVPTALCYWHDVQCPDCPPLLLLGDEKGGVHLMWFLNPLKGLFNNPPKKQNGPHRIYFPDLSEHNKTVSHRYIPNIHQGPINRVMFEPSASDIMTSSESATSSVAFVNVTLRREPHVWKIDQGAKCFDYSASLQLMVTGGRGRAVTLWTRFVTTRPVATLLGHGATILDVAIHPTFGQIFSYSRDAELRVWDIATHHCLKTLRLQFPCLKPGRIPEHGNFPFLFLGPPLPVETPPHFVVGCKDYLARLYLAERRRGRGGTGAALSCALYNPTLGQVATGHADSSVSLWDVETGQRRLQILNAHGEDELLCMTLDSTHRRLITGARNGTIKVWNSLNGLNLHKLEPVSNSEVTMLTCLHDNKLLAVGWSRRIVQYDIGAAKDVYVRADMSWKSGGVHKSDILAVCQCPALGVVATASHDGEVVVWRPETQRPLLHLKTAGQAGVAPPVDGLLFLQHRAANRKQRTRGVLVSSQAGCLRFWSVAGETRAYGEFYAPEQPRARVTSLCSDQPENTILVSGDTTGWIQIWEISHYGLEVQHEPVEERPALLWRWKVHEREAVSVEVLQVADRLFVLTASADGSAGLWTRDGGRVGWFGQEVMWNITDAAAYQREMQTSLRQDMKQEGTTESDVSEASKVTPQQTPQEEASRTRPAASDHEQPQQHPVTCKHTI